MLTVRHLRAQRSCQHDLIAQWPVGLEFSDAFERGANDCAHRFAGEERLMPGDDHVRERNEPLDNVVGDDFVGKILKEQVDLLLVNVDRKPPEVPALERLDSLFGVDEPAAAGVHEQRAGFYRGQSTRVDDVMCLGREGAMREMRSAQAQMSSKFVYAPRRP